MTKRKLSEETNNLKLPDLNTFNIFKEVSETPDYTYFVLKQQDDEKSKELESLFKEARKVTDKLLELLKVKTIDDYPAVTTVPMGESIETETVDENHTQ
jgi:hypothetical protein